jgi:hypothetical protein
MTATPASHPAPVDLLREILRQVDDDSLLAPLFEEASAELSTTARAYGFQPQHDLFEVGARYEPDAVYFSWSRTMVEESFGRHFSVFWELRVPLAAETFGNGVLEVKLCESGFEHPSAEATLVSVTDTWWADMQSGWTPEHCASLVAHFKAAWEQARAGEALLALQGAFHHLDAEMAP